MTDPAMLVTKRMEDFVTWVDTSARKRTIMKYNDEVGLRCPPCHLSSQRFIGMERIELIAILSWMISTFYEGRLHVNGQSYLAFASYLFLISTEMYIDYHIRAVVRPARSPANAPYISYKPCFTKLALRAQQ